MKRMNFIALDTKTNLVPLRSFCNDEVICGEIILSIPEYEE